ncbi:MAG TPA: methyltransferase [Dongiaceae bacterium]
MKVEPQPANTSPEITEDRILGGGLLLRQPASGYRTGIDPVFLAAAAPLRVQGRALDLGCGVGAAALCLALRQPGLQIMGLEIQPPLAELARANVALNGLDERVAIVTGDLLRPPAGIGAGGFDLVLANPPFHEAGKFSAPKEPGRARGHMEGEADLAAWIACALNLAAPRGVLAMIHKPERMGDILARLEGRAGAVSVFPLLSGPGKPARRLLLRAEKGSAAALTLHAGLVLHDADGRYSEAAEAVLRQGMALAF